jgi:hypothetical protein
MHPLNPMGHLAWMFYLHPLRLLIDGLGRFVLPSGHRLDWADGFMVRPKIPDPKAVRPAEWCASPCTAASGRHWWRRSHAAQSRSGSCCFRQPALTPQNHSS